MKKIKTCPECHNTGAVGDRYCDCPAAIALRVRIDNDPEVQRRRAQIEAALERSHGPRAWVKKK